MGRWKGDGRGGSYYDPNDSGPDQVRPGEAGRPLENQPQQPAAPAAAAPAAPAQNPTYQTPGPGGLPANVLQDYMSSVKAWYREYLGREASDNEAYAWANNPNGIWTVQNAIANSDEAKAYQTQQGAPAATTPGQGGGYAYMEGVDTGKMNDPSHTTPKYLIARQLASGVPVSEAIKAVPGTVQLDATRFRLPTGETIDTRRDEEGVNQLQWLVEGGGGGGGAGAGAGAGAGGGAGGAGGGAGGAGGSGSPWDLNSPLLAPFNKPFVPPYGAGGPAAGGGGGGYLYDPYTGQKLTGGEDIPGVPQFNYAAFDPGQGFQAPKGEQVYDDPGYQFRLNQANEAFQNAAYAKGIMGSGGTLKDFLKYNQDMASQEYTNAYNRAKDVYDTNWNNRLNTYTTNFNTAAAQYAPNLTEWQVRASDLRKQQDDAYNRAWDQYKTDMDNYYKGQENAWNRIYGATGLGQQGSY